MPCPDLSAIPQIARGNTTASDIVDRQEVRVTKGTKMGFGKWPRQNGPVAASAELDASLQAALALARHRAAVVAANRITEWSASPTP